jgi:cell division septation protein DedD
MSNSVQRKDPDEALSRSRQTTSRVKPTRWLIVPTVLAIVMFATGAEAAATAVPLGTAKRFAVLTGAGITNTGATTITGDIGTYPTTSITGTQTLTLNGTNHGGDAVTQQAKVDLITAYDDAAGQGPTNPIAGGQLGGRMLRSGVYTSPSSLALTGVLTLDGRGNPEAVFIFQAGAKLTTASASDINLINGAQSCSVFWQIGSSATLGTGSHFQGTILAKTSITATTGAVVRGRLLARNGAVTLDANTITRPRCAPTAAPTPTPTPTPRPTATPTQAATPTPTPTPTATPAPTPTTTLTPSVINPHPSTPKNSFGLTG